tara:strand:- start:22 stop:684 length:663 start_codon:yes stop_codon:yes gene_type:complete
MSIVLNGSTGITTPDIDSTAGFDAPDLTGALPAIDGSALTALTAANLTGALPAIDGAALTGIQTGPTYATEVASTSGTAFDFTGIPAGVKEIKVYLSDVGLASIQELEVQLGNSGGFVASGYVTSSGVLSSSQQAEYNYTTGFGVTLTSPSQHWSGAMTINRNTSTGHIWNQTNAFGGTAATAFGAGFVDVSTEVTQLRVKSLNGVVAFDSGTLNISWSF